MLFYCLTNWIVDQADSSGTSPCRRPGTYGLRFAAVRPADGLRPPPAPWCRSLTATGTPGARTTSRRSYRIARRFAGGSARVFARPGPHFNRGDQSGKGCLQRSRLWRSSFPPKSPRLGVSPTPLPSPLPFGRRETGGGAAREQIDGPPPSRCLDPSAHVQSGNGARPRGIAGRGGLWLAKNSRRSVRPFAFYELSP